MLPCIYLPTWISCEGTIYSSAKLITHFIFTIINLTDIDSTVHSQVYIQWVGMYTMLTCRLQTVRFICCPYWGQFNKSMALPLKLKQAVHCSFYSFCNAILPHEKKEFQFTWNQFTWNVWHSSCISRLLPISYVIKIRIN